MYYYWYISVGVPDAPQFCELKHKSDRDASFRCVAGFDGGTCIPFSRWHLYYERFDFDESLLARLNRRLVCQQLACIWAVH